MSLLRVLDLVQVLLEIASVHLGEAVELLDNRKEEDHDRLLVVLSHAVPDADVPNLLRELLLLVAEAFDLRGLFLSFLVQLDELGEGLLFLVLSLLAF